MKESFKYLPVYVYLETLEILHISNTDPTIHIHSTLLGHSASTWLRLHEQLHPYDVITLLFIIALPSIGLYVVRGHSILKMTSKYLEPNWN